MMYFDRDGKYNFVDENNVVLGYESDCDYYKNADWYLADESPEEADEDRSGAPEGFDFSPYNFDPEFCECTTYVRAGGFAVFRIVAKGLPDKYIVLFNDNSSDRNAFEMKHKGTEIYSHRI